ncbi:MAG TPA: dihydropteroate synthase [Symbiobacteriaceae bacterium]|nr:dihydropteroate synthase [Symbiobacteriaceae bacterium]
MLVDPGRKTWSIPCGERTLHLGDRTVVMGILNVTPDSFSDGGQFVDLQTAVLHALRMKAEGAEIIDIGGESTRPGYTQVDDDEEIARVVPVIQAVRAALPDVLISIDTYKASVAEAALQAGADLINDIWGLQYDRLMAAVAAKYGAPVVVMHNQAEPVYHDLIHDMVAFFRRSIRLAVEAGVTPDRIIIDPGFGFGKTPVQNLELLRRMSELKLLGRPILLGTSRKSTIGKVLGDLPPQERVEGTAATVAIGIQNGAEIVRVHDVQEMKRVAQMTDAIVRPGRGGFVGA